MTTFRHTAAATAVLAAGLVLSVAASGESKADEVPADTLGQGEKLYLKHCRVCHGTKGTAGRPLKGNAKLEDQAFVATAILIGPGYMSPFDGKIPDEEIALITTYVRNSWGNDFGGSMSLEDVSQARANLPEE